MVARIGTSFVSIEEARKNLHTEITDWNLFGYNGLVEVVDAQSF